MRGVGRPSLVVPVAAAASSAFCSRGLRLPIAPSAAAIGAAGGLAVSSNAGRRPGAAAGHGPAERSRHTSSSRGGRSRRLPQGPPWRAAQPEAMPPAWGGGPGRPCPSGLQHQAQRRSSALNAAGQGFGQKPGAVEAALAETAAVDRLIDQCAVLPSEPPPSINFFMCDICQWRASLLLLRSGSGWGKLGRTGRPSWAPT